MSKLLKFQVLEAYNLQNKTQTLTQLADCDIITILAKIAVITACKTERRVQRGVSIGTKMTILHFLVIQLVCRCVERNMVEEAVEE